MATGKSRPPWQRGFTYIGILLAVAIVGIWLTATANVWHLHVQREKEKELLYVGNEFRKAIEHYSAATVGGGRRYPVRLEDLVLDERFLQKRRHLRRIYTDPVTGTADWGLVRLADGEIIGVHSLSTDEPVKKADFALRDLAFTSKRSYSQWVFLAAGAIGAARPATDSAASAAAKPATTVTK